MNKTSKKLEKMDSFEFLMWFVFGYMIFTFLVLFVLFVFVT